MNYCNQPAWGIASGIIALLAFIPIFDLYYKLGGTKIDHSDGLSNIEAKIYEKHKSIVTSLVLAVFATGTLERFLLLNTEGTALIIQMIFAPFAMFIIVFFSAKYLGLKQRKNHPFNWEEPIN